MRNRQITADLLQAFRESRSQVETTYVEKSVERVEKKSTRQPTRAPHKNVTSDRYSVFLEKYDHLEENIDSFKTQDLMYYFREKARESGVKYVIANMKRDMGIFKRLLDNYESREICLMIEFLFFSEQDYLDKTSIQPTVLASGWCNTIYQDAMLWVDDKYVPRSQKPTPSKKHIKSREWSGSPDEERVEIGGWDD